MNQEKIGKFISELRKEKKLTQQELAERLGVTDRSVSNWENGKNMPDLSLFKPLCEILNISINDLMNGEKIKSEEYQVKTNEIMINTINYSNDKIKSNILRNGIILIVVGLVITLFASSVYRGGLNNSATYIMLGGIVSLIGVSKISKKLYYSKRFIINFGYIILFFVVVFIIDFFYVKVNNEIPNFYLRANSSNNVVYYDCIFYDVYVVNDYTNNRYVVVDTNNKYTLETIPNPPFNRLKSGINNIIKYKNKYVGNNSNDYALIGNLPLSEYGYVFEIDTENLGLIINYNITDWYIEDSHYLSAALVYNSVSIFNLIDNVEYVKFNFSGASYEITRNDVENNYPNYKEINNNLYDNFDKYVESKMNDINFVEQTFYKLFK